MNFFKKYWIVILIITLLCISAIIGIFEGIQEYKQEPKTLSNHPPRTKRELETSKPKIPITQEKYDKIKSYILSENENEVLTINDLPKQELTEINKIKNSWTKCLNDLNEHQKWINEYQKECDDYNKKISQLNPQDGFDKIKIKSLTEQLEGAEGLKNDSIKSFDRRLKEYKQSILSSLNSLYEITLNEG
ncbi:hypothetical protein [Candidatus Phytoplasma fraxini]|uniref:Uncharacterized protein n=1 Tax=Ash yellows phytoplasma TaxID=35780 RepID=A0ABZ2U9L0_ASHYP